MHGYKERAQFMLSEFANKNLLSKEDEYKQTALHLAADHGKTEVVKVLIDAARHLPSFKSYQDEEAALHQVVKRGNMDIARLLVTQIQVIDIFNTVTVKLQSTLPLILGTTCAYPNLQGPDGTSALHAALAKFPDRGMLFVYHSTCLHNIYCIYEIKRT